MYLLDTNVCIALLNGTSEPALRRLQASPVRDVAICSTVKSELLFGARRSQCVEANLQTLQKFFEPFLSLPFDDRCAEEAAIIRTSLAEQGRPVGPHDLMIAAIARANDRILVTHDQQEFYRIAGLRLEDWQA